MRYSWLVLLLLASVSFAQQKPLPPCNVPHVGECDGLASVVLDDGPIQSVARPDPKLTPGVVRTSDATEICAKSFRTKPFRKTTSAMKKHVCLEYHTKPCPAAGKMEIDHLLPLELGGLDDERNLWVQLAPEYHWKDALENKLKHLVCVDKTLDLKTAQQEIMTDWPAAYVKHVGPLPKH